MGVELLEIRRESHPAACLIGKRYHGAPDWGQWWQNGWFETLEAIPAAPLGGDAYFGASRVVGGQAERWIGMLFPAGTKAPEGFEAAEMDARAYAVCVLRDCEGSSGFYATETHRMCLDALKAHGLIRREDDWCLERYACPGFTTPDAQGRVVLEYALSVETQV